MNVKTLASLKKENSSLKQKCEDLTNEIEEQKGIIDGKQAQIDDVE